MNHDDEYDFFKQLDADLAAEDAADSGEVVDLNKARAARAQSTGSTTAQDADQSADSGADRSGSESADPAATVMVDGPAPAGPGYFDRLRAAKRRPVRPAWMQSVTELKTAASWVAGHYGHTCAYHGLRAPAYAGRLMLQSPRGTARFLGETMRWVADKEGEPVRLAAVRREDAADYLKLSRQRDGRVRLRTLVAVLASLIGLGGALALYVLAPGWLQTVSVGALLMALGFAGQEADAPVITRAVDLPGVERLTSDIVVRAFTALGIAEINKQAAKGKALEFKAPIQRDGKGWRADVDLPYGVTVSDILDRRERLASGLRKPLGCVWPEPVPGEHTGRLMLWVGDQDMAKAPQPSWPLLKSGTASLFKPVPYGTDPRGRAVDFDLMYANFLVGAMPGRGKTFALRILLLAAAMDPTAELHTWEFKGTGDFSSFQPISHTYGSGPGDDATVEGCVEALEYVYGELDRRARVINGLPKDICPENKVTPALAAKKSLGLHPLVMTIDECQEVFTHEQFGKKAAELATAIIKRGRALGVILLLGTQRPDADSLPKAISANVGIRFCLQVMGQPENDMVLGTSMYKNGIRATSFTSTDLGIGYLVGSGPNPQIVRSYYIDNATAEKLCERAHAARAAAGTLPDPGAAKTEKAADTLLTDVLAVIPAGETKVWNETVIDRLAELRPERYGEWGQMTGADKTAHLTAALKPYGIKVRQVGRRIDGEFVNQRGIERQAVADAIAERNRKRDAS
ncbi:cell division protein FtsK [Streptomyces sp. TM32]|uniref:FtsK/SpoIIIE domain-containing protein n=1 Tax=Streptomyces sp. TM32 TaxID=1652669 RepID=UPI0010111B78|nr:FtsK/SpoIIIE domain-containing protein [Streptomyces sp. TM32]RXS83785.1 cell division protein FtsK [Streptomyces sp. TM32]